MDDARRASKVKLHLTGFGKFQGVADNPTTHLIPALVRELGTRAELNIEISHADVMETSMVGVREILDSYERTVAADADSALHIWLHFGVHGGARSVFLEQTAVNDATFRVPDERGESPSKEPIELAEPWSCHRHCALPLHAIAGTLEAAGHPVQLSSDAGRFLCNFAYYKSLSATERLNARTSEHAPTPPPQHFSLFVHIPPFSELPLDRLVACSAAIVAEVSESMRAGTEPYLASRNSLQRSAIALLALPLPTDTQRQQPVVDEPSADVSAGLYGASKRPRAPAAAASSPALVAAPAVDPPGTGAPAATTGPPAALEALLAFGFPRDLCLAAIAATNTGPHDAADRAAEWVFEHGLEDSSGDVESTSLPPALPKPAPPVDSGRVGGGREFKLIIVVRSDLGMRPGKIAAQACHGETLQQGCA